MAPWETGNGGRDIRASYDERLTGLSFFDYFYWIVSKMRVTNKYEYGVMHSFMEIPGVGAFEVRDLKGETRHESALQRCWGMLC